MFGIRDSITQENPLLQSKTLQRNLIVFPFIDAYTNTPELN